MPKEIQEVSQFITGTMTTPSERDIPPDAASFSLNIEPASQDGILQGVPDHTNVQFTSGGSSTDLAVNATTMALINDAGERDLVFYDASTERIKKVDNLHAATAQSANLSGSGESRTGRPVMQVNNKEVHIGMGSGSANKPRWVGHIPHGQFGGSAPSGLQLDDAKLNKPAVFADMHKVVEDNTYIYGIEYGQQTLFRFKISDGTLDKVGNPITATTADLTAIALASDGNIWLLDSNSYTGQVSGTTSGTAGVLYKVDKTTFNILQTNTLKVDTGISREKYSDMCEVGNYLYISAPIGSEAITPLNTVGGANDNNMGRAGALLNVPTNQDPNSGAVVLVANLDPSPSSAWQTNQTHTTPFSQTSSTISAGESGSAMTVIAYTDGSGNPYFKIVSGGTNYKVGDQIIFTDPGSSSNTATLVVSRLGGISESGESWCRSIMPRIYASNSPTEGQFDYQVGSTPANPIHNVPYVNLFPLADSTTHIGMAISISNSDSDNLPARFQKASGTIDSRCGIIQVSQYSSKVDSAMNELKSLYGATNAYYPIQTVDLFADDDGGVKNAPMGYATSDGQTYFYVSHKHSTDVDRSVVYRFDIPDVDSDTNGNQISYSASTNDNDIDLKNAAGCIVGSDFHMFSSGDSVGRWAKYSSVNSSYNGKTPTSILQGDLNLSLALSSGDNSTGFTANKNYFYKTSYIYDGYQESPISSEFLISQGSSAKEVQVTIELFNISTIRKRISHVNIYMAEGDSGSSNPKGFYRLVKSIALDGNNWTNVSDDATDPDWGDKKQYSFLHNGKTLASYEARTGISEILDDTILNYGLSTQLNNQLFVADCYHPQLTAPSEDIKNYIFKSRPYNYDQFNYVQDFLALPTTPTAIIGFRGRIYVFDENNMYKIEPNNFYIEDTIEGIGCSAAESVYANDYGMCIANKNNIYLYDGTRPIPIGEPILKGDDLAWENNQADFTPRVSFDSTRKCFLVFFRNDGTLAAAKSHTGNNLVNDYYAWAYNITRKRWDCWYFKGVKPKSILVGASGEVLISDETNLVHFLGHSSNKLAFCWISKKMSMNQNTGDKSFKNLRIIGSPNGAIGQSSSEGAYIYTTVDDSDITETSITGLTDIGLNNSRGKQIQVFLIGQTSTIDAFGVVFRRYIKLSKQN